MARAQFDVTQALQAKVDSTDTKKVDSANPVPAEPSVVPSSSGATTPSPALSNPPDPKKMEVTVSSGTMTITVTASNQAIPEPPTTAAAPTTTSSSRSLPPPPPWEFNPEFVSAIAQGSPSTLDPELGLAYKLVNGRRIYPYNEASLFPLEGPNPNVPELKPPTAPTLKQGEFQVLDKPNQVAAINGMTQDQIAQLNGRPPGEKPKTVAVVGTFSTDGKPINPYGHEEVIARLYEQQGSNVVRVNIPWSPGVNQDSVANAVKYLGSRPEIDGISVSNGLSTTTDDAVKTLSSLPQYAGQTLTKDVLQTPQARQALRDVYVQSPETPIAKMNLSIEAAVNNGKKVVIAAGNDGPNNISTTSVTRPRSMWEQP